MKIVMIGTGNVATVFTKKFIDAGHEVLQVAGRNETAAKELATLGYSDYTTNFASLNGNADIYILAINDSAIATISREINLENKLLVHTAGAVSKEILKGAARHYGVFYPLQTITKNIDPKTVIPIHIDADNEQNLAVLKELALSISGKVFVSDDAERLKLHTAAVVCNNFTNYLFTLAASFCNHENIDFNHLLPLIDETTKKLRTGNPWQHQTGPARRHDDKTIQNHLEVLHDHHELKEVYQFLTSKIREHAKV